jgi:hypothetical protein
MTEKGRGPLKPTVISPPDRSRKAAREPAVARHEDAAEGAAQIPVKPTAIAGVERKRIAVDAGALRTLSPGLAGATVEAALRLLATFVAEKASERRAILWGHDLQRAHNDLVAETLTLSQAPVLRKAETYIRRMMDILAAIDIMAVCGHGNGGLGRYFKGMNDKIDSPAELSAAQAELDLLVRHMNEALDELLDLKDQLQRQVRKFEEIGEDADAAALAALFLSRHLQKDKAAVAQCFLERSMSLTQTVAQIRENNAVREIQIEQPVRMVGAIQNVVLVSMPDLLASIASVTSLTARKASLSPTEAGELNYKLRDFLNRLAS